MIRIMSLVDEAQGLTQLDDESEAIDEKTGCDLAKLVRSTQVRFKSDESIMQGYPEISGLLGQETVRHCWSLLQSFNKHFAEVVPYVN